MTATEIGPDGLAALQPGDLVGPVAKAWLAREAANGWPSAVGGRFVFDARSLRQPDGSLDVKPLLAVLPLYSRRFRQRIVWVAPGVGVWLDNHRMEQTDQLTRLRIDPDTTAIDDLTARRLEVPLDPSRPLWDCVLVDGLPDERVALIFRVHEAVSDGAPPPADWDDADKVPAPAPTPWEVQQMAKRVRRHAVLGLPAATVRRAKHAPSALKAVPRIVASRNPWMGAFTGERFVHSAQVPLAAVRSLRDETCQRVGDILVAVVMEGVRRGLAAEGVKSRTIGAMTMVANIEPQGRSVTAWFLNVPNVACDLETRTRQISEQTDWWRAANLQGGVDLMSDLGMKTWGRFGRERGRKPISLMAITNVGSFGDVWNASDVPMVDMHLYGAVMPGMPLNFALVGSPGRVQIGMQADRGAVPACRAIARGLESTLAELVAGTDQPAGAAFGGGA